LQTQNHAGQQCGDLRPYVTWDRFIDDGLRARTRLDSASALRPGLHPGCHPTPEKERETQALAAESGSAHGVSTQLLVMGSQILPSGWCIAGPVQRRFF